MEVDEPATTSHKRGKIRSYTISFKPQVIEYAGNHSIVALKYKVDSQSIRDWKKKRTCYNKFQLQRIVKRGSA